MAFQAISGLTACLLVSGALVGSIRDVDFRNFHFPFEGWCTATKDSECELVLHDGQASVLPLRAADLPLEGYLTANVAFVRYGDLTGDGKDEAVVRLGWNAGGTGQFSQLFVYTLSHRLPKLLASLPLGDRAQGGYLDACIRDQRLVAVRLRGEGAIGVDGVDNFTYSWRDDHLVVDLQSTDLFAEQLRDCDSFWYDCRRYHFDRQGNPVDFVNACGNSPYAQR